MQAIIPACARRQPDLSLNSCESSCKRSLLKRDFQLLRLVQRLAAIDGRQHPMDGNVHVIPAGADGAIRHSDIPRCRVSTSEIVTGEAVASAISRRPIDSKADVRVCRSEGIFESCNRRTVSNVFAGGVVEDIHRFFPNQVCVTQSIQNVLQRGPSTKRPNPVVFELKRVETDATTSCRSRVASTDRIVRSGADRSVCGFFHTLQWIREWGAPSRTIQAGYRIVTASFTS